MAFAPEPSIPGSLPALEEIAGSTWTPLFKHNCSFPPEIFRQVMLNQIRNPNINSPLLFRADISLNVTFSENFNTESEIPPRISHFKNFDLKTVMVRTMIPRNALLDKALDQTCMFYEQQHEEEVLSLVTYVPHISSAAEAPFYHPAVQGIGFLHKFNKISKEGDISIHYSFYDSEPRSTKLERTAQHLLAALHKHGQGSAAGYVKRVQHDVILPQAIVQNTYARLKAKYGKALCEGWVESTDPTKHVFEDLGIAAFLIELWAEMYKEKPFPGFVDIGCGNGLLVHILLEEGYSGWGFDARKRKSWSTWSQKAQDNLRDLVLIPSIIQTCRSQSPAKSNPPERDTTQRSEETKEETQKMEVGIHNGVFPDGTFIISNHADELTPWTPILATISSSPFIMIPCCSHALSGSRFRAPPPKNASASTSAFASLVVWVSKIAEDCGWEVEKEMLRIPSTRNTALIGRRRQVGDNEVDILELIQRYGGAEGWEENSMKLVKGTTRGH
ncbi:tRNA (uracil-O(2)-)-methyltransferase [Lachnellula suecica]|uniref:tRNA (uracil-O(2)-)-methyltransferase n=1 Tax=Lachnellula suecica TaxID=602035 RepID=A0A8T9CG22_9HELO|nr:tRNA (uracil-O(2)-)-methyltransferase [Lachnellula suecica]